MTEEAFKRSLESTRDLLVEAVKVREDRSTLLAAIRTAIGDRPEGELGLEEQTLLAVAEKVEGWR